MLLTVAWLQDSSFEGKLRRKVLLLSRQLQVCTRPAWSTSTLRVAPAQRLACACRNLVSPAQSGSGSSASSRRPWRLLRWVARKPPLSWLSEPGQVDTLQTFCKRWTHRAPPLHCRHPVRQPPPPCRSVPPAAAQQASQARSAHLALLGPSAAERWRLTQPGRASGRQSRSQRWHPAGARQAGRAAGALRCGRPGSARRAEPGAARRPPRPPARSSELRAARQAFPARAALLA